MIDPSAYAELEAIVGSENVSQEDVICDSYAVQPFHRGDTGYWIPRPAAVVLPQTTEEVSAVVKLCNKYKIKYKAFSTGFGAEAGPGVEGVIQIDLRRMNRIIEIDEKNMIAVIEPYASGMEIQMEAMKKGLNFNVITAGPQTSPLASATSHMGGGCSSISMGFNARNLMAFEWVTPTGEIVQVGSPESTGEWFSCDGPGPSIRGVIRGFQGYDGGFGVFTKCAIKLYHWPGPSELKVSGNMFDAELEVPEQFQHYFMLLPDWKAISNAFLKMAETEVCSFMSKFSAIILSYMMIWDFMADWMAHPALKPFANALQHCVQIIIQGDSPEELEWKAKVLRKIAEEEGGFVIGGHPETHLEKNFWLADLKASHYLMLFAGKGFFHVAMGADDSADAIMLQGRIAEEIKQGFIEKGICFDDAGDGTWATMYEQGAVGHCEATMLFDPRDPTHAEAFLAYSMACGGATLEQHLGGIGFNIFGGPQVVEMFNADMNNFWGLTQRVKKTWDPDLLADLTIT